MNVLLLVVLAVCAAAFGKAGWLILAAYLLILAAFATWTWGRARVYGLAPGSLRLLRVIDGDTFETTAPPGSPAHLGGVVSVRLRGVDAVKLSEPGGETAKLILKDFLRRGPILCSNVGRDKYGRALVTVTVRGKDAGAHLIEHGLAVLYEGGAR